MNYIKSLRSVVGTQPIIAPGSAVIVMNDRNEILLQLRSDTNDWGVPGGGLELGDSFEEAAIRELHEETGLTAHNLRLLKVVSGQDFYFRYPHGDEVYNVTAIFRAISVTGDLRHDDESLELAYFSLNSLPQLNYISQKILEKIGYLNSLTT